MQRSPPPPNDGLRPSGGLTWDNMVIHTLVDSEGKCWPWRKKVQEEKSSTFSPIRTFFRSNFFPDPLAVECSCVSVCHHQGSCFQNRLPCQYLLILDQSPHLAPNFRAIAQKAPNLAPKFRAFCERQLRGTETVHTLPPASSPLAVAFILIQNLSAALTKQCAYAAEIRQYFLGSSIT